MASARMLSPALPSALLLPIDPVLLPQEMVVVPRKSNVLDWIMP